ARTLEDGQELSAHEGRMARAAPVHACAALGVVRNAVAHALRLQALLDPEARDLGEPLLSGGLMHRHQVLVEEPDEVHAEPPARVLDEIDHVGRAVVAYQW